MEKLRLLFINDSNDELSLFKTSIRRQVPATKDGIEVQTFGPNEAPKGIAVGEAFIQSLKDKALGPQSFEVIFADHSMPGMNGAQLVKKLHQDSDLRSVPIIMMSKDIQDMLEGAVDALAEGASGYIGSSIETPEVFWREVSVTARRAFQDKQRERWSQAALAISRDLHETGF